MARDPGPSAPAASPPTGEIIRIGGPELQAVTEWIWLLHDDCEPGQDSLARLLETAAGDPTIGIVGPKHQGWFDERALLEVGVTIARGGRRETGLDEYEVDQGQHDGVLDVMAVNTAGLLIRRELWDDLGGLDPLLALARDDVDLGWRAHLAGHRVVCQTGAVMRHAEAASHGRRPVTARAGRARRQDRRNALHVLLVNLPLTSLPAALIRLAVCSLFRALLFAAGGRGRRALDELLAALAVAARPDHLIRGRLARRHTRTVGARSATPWLAPRRAGVAHAVDSLASVLGRTQPRVPVIDTIMDLREGTPERRTTAYAGGQPGSRQHPSTAPGARASMLGVLLWPGVVTVAALSLLAVVAGRGLLGPGRLVGGALLPAPDGAYALWRSALASWHPVGLGSSAMAPPDLAALAALSLPLFGSVDRLVDLLMLGGVPLCGAAAWLLLRQLSAHRWLCVWGAVTYALLPSVTGAIASGRLGVVVLAVLVPLIALGSMRALTRGPRRTSALSAAFGTGAALALACAFEPVSYLLAVVVALVVAVLAVRGWALPRLVVVLAVPAGVLLPMTLAALADPGLLLRSRGMPVGPGLGPDSGVPGLEQLGLLLLDPGFSDSRPWWWAGAGVVALAYVALVRAGRIAGVRVAAGVAVSGLTAALLLPHVAADPLADAGPVWPGPALVVAGLALVVCGVVAGPSLLSWWVAARAGTGRAITAVVVLAAAAAPVLSAVQWSSAGAGGLLVRAETDLLPAYVVHDARSGARARTVVIGGGGVAGGELRITLLRDRGPQLGDADLLAAGPAPVGLAAAVGLLAAGTGDSGTGDAGSEWVVQLREFGVGYLLAARPVDAGLASTIDAQVGLTRVSSPDGDALWRLDRPGARARVVGADGTELAAVDAGEVGVDTTLEDGPAGRRLVLAENAHPGWQATVDGVALQAVEPGWAQTFALPVSGGRLVVRHVDADRDLLVLGQGVLVVLVLLAALPGARRDPPRSEVHPARARVGAV